MLPADPGSSTIRERTHIDLATADLALGHLDAVEADLEPVWDVPIPRRRYALTDRLHVLARALTAPAYGSASQAISLRDQIEVFTTEAQARSLPAT
jgi:hypothetical protein